ncbi:hypothetical protein [Desulfobacter postgatei]|uniref:hypothetical protein n=1 Tax=Desulfobacter postgatei TaxID=2293 RepID=UPI002FD97D32
MTFIEYSQKHPLTKNTYTREDVEKIRRHAFINAIPKKKETRSDKQNRYYWGVVLKIIGDDLGYSTDEIHQLMQREFLKYENKENVFFRSTTTLNTKEMETYLENIRRFAILNLGIYVPLPNETEFQYEVA